MSSPRTEESPSYLCKSGYVKWYNASKNFGFVIDSITGEEILLHLNILQSYGISSITEGTHVELEVVVTNRGLQASKLLRVETCNNPDEAQAVFAELHSVSSEFVPARVKWFDSDKGFGFVNTFGSAEDHFVLLKILRLGGLETVSQGEALSVQIGVGEKGSVVVAVMPWKLGRDEIIVDVAS